MRLFFCLFAVSLAASASAQPLTQQRSGLLSIERVDALSLDPLDNAELRAEALADRSLLDGPAPYPYARARTVSASVGQQGTWERLGDGQHVWRLLVESPGALSLDLGFSQFSLPEGATLWMYRPGEAPVFRPFTADDAGPTGTLWTPIMEGDRVVLEINLPADVRPEAVEVVLSDVGHAYRGVLGVEDEGAFDGQKSGSCNVDTVCSQGDAYRDIIQSVGQYTFRSGGSSFVCTGAAVNNTAQDGRPYFLTANHCVSSPAEASSMVVYWNYENSTCRTPGSFQSGQRGDGSRAQFSTGTTLRATYRDSDVTLVEIDAALDDRWNVFLAGWDRADEATSRAIAIHHPAGEEKRISFENDPSQITTYGSPLPNPSGDFIQIRDWDLGTTEGGSSGSPLFDENQRIVGQLTGGSAACGNDAPDWYGRIASSWPGGGSAGSRLSDWLDPTGSGALALDGRSAASAVPSEVLPTAGGFALSAPYPNPAQRAASLTLTVDSAQPITATLYDALGRRVAVLLHREVSAAAPVRLGVPLADLPVGAYLVRVEGETFTATRRVLVVR